MQWSLKQKSWRPIAMRIALLTFIWIVMAFIFATELFLAARGLPIQITWTVAVRNAFRDWFPWIILSPIAVVLAGRFRFEQNNWKRNIAIHLTACLLFTFAYEGLLFLISPGPLVVSTGGIEGGIGVFSTSAAAPQFGGGPPGAMELLPPPEHRGSNSFVFHTRKMALADGTARPPDSNNVVFGSTGKFSVFDEPERHVQLGFWNSPLPGRRMQFLHLAMTRMQFTIPIYLCIICICWIINHFQESGERERRTLELETRLTQANLQTLKMQLQPHFLFNTLNAISSLVHENPRIADDMIGSLSQFLRSTLEISKLDEVSLREELQFVRRYLEIQQIRFGERLHIVYDIGEPTMTALVPPLILQPLLENSIRHGIESREGSGTIVIHASQRKDQLHLAIVDDGEGFKGRQLLEILNGVGLSNTKARLQELYGENHQIKLTANEPNGARVLIGIPFRIAEEVTA